MSFRPHVLLKFKKIQLLWVHIFACWTKCFPKNLKETMKIVLALLRALLCPDFLLNLNLNFFLRARIFVLCVQCSTGASDSIRQHSKPGDWMCVTKTEANLIIQSFLALWSVIKYGEFIAALIASIWSWNIQKPCISKISQSQVMDGRKLRMQLCTAWPRIIGPRTGLGRHLSHGYRKWGPSNRVDGAKSDGWYCVKKKSYLRF